MSMEFADHYDVLVIGAGHAGIEGALAAARLGVSAAMFTINLDSVGNLPCNPSIGGTAKGHLVREIDALGGEMGKAADQTFLQSRMLNRGKGPAVHSLRAQIDRRQYSDLMKIVLEGQPGLDLIQAEIVSLVPENGGWAATTHLGAVYAGKTVVIATGTTLGGRIFVGEHNFQSGPDGLFAATRLTDSLRKILPIRRFKTGTPARVHKKSIDFSRMEVQIGDDPVTPFSFETIHPGPNRVVCHLTTTTQATRDVIQQNLHRSPLFRGDIQGIGTRYCPSIEDKFHRFADKDRHQVFIEPCGLDTQEMYLQGLSTSLPEDVQRAFYRTVVGLENVKIMRSAYAIEYDCVDPLALSASLEAKDAPGLFGAGQFNGSSGYEEAAAQGLVAGINAARKCQGKPPFTLSRASSYIGTLIDDLVTRGCTDPYRMMTSRSEYRLCLRQDNADERLTPIGRELGLIKDRRWAAFCEKKTLKEKEIARINRTVFPPSDKLNEILTALGTPPKPTGVRLADLLKRPAVTLAALTAVDDTRPPLPQTVLEGAEIEVKYEGYIKRQDTQIKEQQRLEEHLIPDGFDYAGIGGFRKEAVEKLMAVRPRSLGQASRISGVTPADIAVLIVALRGKNR